MKRMNCIVGACVLGLMASSPARSMGRANKNKITNKKSDEKSATLPTLKFLTPKQVAEKTKKLMRALGTNGVTHEVLDTLNAYGWMSRKQLLAEVQKKVASRTQPPTMVGFASKAISPSEKTIEQVDKTLDRLEKSGAIESKQGRNGNPVYRITSLGRQGSSLLVQLMDAVRHD